MVQQRKSTQYGIGMPARVQHTNIKDKQSSDHGPFLSFPSYMSHTKSVWCWKPVFTNYILDTNSSVNSRLIICSWRFTDVMLYQCDYDCCTTEGCFYNMHHMHVLSLFLKTRFLVIVFQMTCILLSCRRPHEIEHSLKITQSWMARDCLARLQSLIYM